MITIPNTDQTTIVNQLEQIQDITKVHGKVMELISKDYIYAYVPEEKKLPLSKIISQLYFGYWIKNHIAKIDSTITDDERKLIKQLAQLDLDRQLVQYNIWITMKRNEADNPLVELIITGIKEHQVNEEDEMEQKSAKQAIKDLLKPKKKKSKIEEED